MIRVLALYSQCKQQFNISAASVIECLAAKLLASVLKTLLGLEVIIKLILMIYLTLAEDSKLLIDPHETKPDKSAQSVSSALARKVLLYADQRDLHYR